MPSPNNAPVDTSTSLPSRVQSPGHTKPDRAMLSMLRRLRVPWNATMGRRGSLSPLVNARSYDVAISLNDRIPRRVATACKCTMRRTSPRARTVFPCLFLKDSFALYSENSLTRPLRTRCSTSPKERGATPATAERRRCANRSKSTARPLITRFVTDAGDERAPRLPSAWLLSTELAP